MAKQKYTKEATQKPVVGLETSSEEIIPTDVGVVEDLGFVESEAGGTLEPVSESEEIEGDGTGEALPEVDEEPENIPEQDKVSSVAQVMDRAQNDSRVDTTVPTEPTEDVATNEEPTVMQSATPADISAIIKRTDISLLDKIELIAKSVDDRASAVIKSLLALYVLGSKTATRQPDTMNREQRAFVRSFIRLSNQSFAEDFNHAMKYINWVYKQLTDEKVLDKEVLTLIRGVSPLDPTNSCIFTAGKDDKELITFVYLITVLDVKANAKTPSEKARKIDINKTTADTLLTEEMINKINIFYSL